LANKHLAIKLFGQNTNDLVIWPTNVWLMVCLTDTTMTLSFGQQTFANILFGQNTNDLVIWPTNVWLKVCLTDTTMTLSFCLQTFG
jgi:hypothetical protein